MMWIIQERYYQLIQRTAVFTIGASVYTGAGASSTAGSSAGALRT